jgi:NTP pyrophosphatase (non-canonical NTP hydrolase)
MDTVDYPQFVDALDAAKKMPPAVPVPDILPFVLSSLSSSLSVLDMLKKNLFYGKEVDFYVLRERMILAQSAMGAACESLSVSGRFVFQEDIVPVRLLHGVIGMATEVGELLDVILSLQDKYLFCKKAGAAELQDNDLQTLLEECGDVSFYKTAVLNSIGFTASDEQRANIAKLSRRYPGGVFNAEQAISRDTSAEAQAMRGVSG